MSGKLETIYREVIDELGCPERLVGVMVRIKDVTSVAALDGHAFELGFGTHAYRLLLKNELASSPIAKVRACVKDIAVALANNPGTAALLCWPSVAMVCVTWNEDRSAVFVFCPRDVGGFNSEAREAT